jgi:uncharacterized membrane protein YqjE
MSWTDKYFQLRLLIPLTIIIIYVITMALLVLIVNIILPCVDKVNRYINHKSSNNKLK